MAADDLQLRVVFCQCDDRCPIRRTPRDRDVNLHVCLTANGADWYARNRSFVVKHIGSRAEGTLPS